MNAGIDFGTSSCSIGVWRNGQPVLLELEGGGTRLSSALHSTRPGLAIRVPTLAGKRRRKVVVPDDHDVTFGEAAIQQHLLDPQEGYFVKSPKSFLGADIKQPHIELFSEIITRMLAHIKQRAEAQVDARIDAICLGRPVRFHGLRGDAGDRQAVSILEKSEIAAGFDHVEFMFEPIAAALDYERQIDRDRVALVLDAGGGTTDCSMVRVGPSFRDKLRRDDSVLGYSGDRVGGTDFDIKLAMRTLMPHFGKDSLLRSGLPVPATVYWNAVAINDVNALADFSSWKTGQEIRQLLADAVEKEKVARLLALHAGRLGYRLNRSAELAKIELSDRESTTVSLTYIEPGFDVSLTRAELKAAIERELDVFVGLMQEAAKQSQTAPDVIYVTGGMAKSPLVEECIRANFGDIEIVVGDLFGSVTSGLATWANRTFR